MTTQMLLVRHGQTEWNSTGRWQGQSDIPLNETGRAQAQALARRLAGWPITALYSSDLRRAADTAGYVGAALNLPYETDPAWRERSFGVLEGLTMPEVAARYPEAYAQIARDDYALPGGEDDAALSRRVVDAFERVSARHPGEMVAVVSHGGAIGRLLAHVLGLPLHSHGRFSIAGNTSLTLVEVADAGSRLLLLNDTAHLEPWAERRDQARF